MSNASKSAEAVLATIVVARRRIDQLAVVQRANTQNIGRRDGFDRGVDGLALGELMSKKSQDCCVPPLLRSNSVLFMRLTASLTTAPVSVIAK